MVSNEMEMIRDAFSEFASKPTSIIYAGIIILLSISEWQKPTDLLGLTYKIFVLIISFIVVTIFNTKYFKNYWKNIQ